MTVTVVPSPPELDEPPGPAMLSDPGVVAAGGTTSALGVVAGVGTGVGATVGGAVGRDLNGEPDGETVAPGTVGAMVGAEEAGASVGAEEVGLSLISVGRRRHHHAATRAMDWHHFQQLQ